MYLSHNCRQLLQVESVERDKEQVQREYIALTRKNRESPSSWVSAHALTILRTSCFFFLLASCFFLLLASCFLLLASCLLLLASCFFLLASCHTHNTHFLTQGSSQPSHGPPNNNGSWVAQHAQAHAPTFFNTHTSPRRNPTTGSNHPTTTTTTTTTTAAG